MKYDLEERTKNFAKESIILCKSFKVTLFNKNILEQLLRSSTSVGANYREANGASSKNDFKNKIHICRKEIQETKYWLELLNETQIQQHSELITNLMKEAHELTLIFNSISYSLRVKDNKFN